MNTRAYEKKTVPITEMLRNTALLVSDFKHRHGDPTATESLDVHVIHQNLSLEVNPSARFRVEGLGLRVKGLGFRVGFRVSLITVESCL